MSVKSRSADRRHLESGSGLYKISPGCENCYAQTFAERFRECQTIHTNKVLI